MAPALGLIDLGVLLALGFLIALSYAYSYSLGAAIVALAKAIGSIRLPRFLGGGRVLGFAADALTAIDDTIRHQLGVGIAAMQATWNDCVSYTAYAVNWIGREIASLSHDTAAAVEGLTVRQVPRWVTRGLVAATAAIAALKARTLALEHTGVGRVEKITRVVERKTVVVEHAIAQPGIGTIPKALPRVGQVEREIADGLARLRDFARRFGPAAAVGTVAFVLARLGMTWARCSNVRKVGRNVCGMNPDLLESLLADALLVVGTVSIVEFAKELQAIEGEVVGGLVRFVREV